MKMQRWQDAGDCPSNGSRPRAEEARHSGAIDLATRHRQTGNASTGDVAPPPAEADGRNWTRKRRRAGAGDRNRSQKPQPHLRGHGDRRHLENCGCRAILARSHGFSPDSFGKHDGYGSGPIHRPSMWAPVNISCGGTESSRPPMAAAPGISSRRPTTTHRATGSLRESTGDLFHSARQRVCGHLEGLYVSDDAGITWKHAALPATLPTCNSVVVRGDQASDVAYAACGDFSGAGFHYSIYRNTDAAGTGKWVSVQTDP